MKKNAEFIHVEDDDKPVGYGKPPKHTQFRKGKSGNPKGRPRAADYAEAFKGWESPLRKYLLEPIAVVVKGKKETMPVVDALILGAIRKALEGSTRHLKILLDGSDGLKALIQEQQRQKNSADEAMIEAVYEAAKNWYS